MCPVRRTSTKESTVHLLTSVSSPDPAHVLSVSGPPTRRHEGLTVTGRKGATPSLVVTSPLRPPVFTRCVAVGTSPGRLTGHP